MDDIYALLGLPRDCPQEVLSSVYKKRVLEWHPDRPGTTPEQQAMVVRLNSIWAAVKTAERRAEYDFALTLQNPVPQQSGPQAPVEDPLIAEIARVQRAQRMREAAQRAQAKGSEEFHPEAPKDTTPGHSQQPGGRPRQPAPAPSGRPQQIPGRPRQASPPPGRVPGRPVPRAGQAHPGQAEQPPAEPAVDWVKMLDIAADVLQMFTGTGKKR